MRWRGQEVYSKMQKCEGCGMVGYSVEDVRFNQIGRYYQYCPDCQKQHIDSLIDEKEKIC